MSWPGRIVLLAVALVAGNGCTQRLPILPAASADDASLSCRSIDREVRRAAAVRAAAIEEGKVQAINELIGAADGQLQMRLGIIAIGLPVSANGQRRFERARVAADNRMATLLGLKLNENCPPGDTADEALSDLDVARRLRHLDEQYGALEIDRRTRLTQRAALLDLIE